MGFSTMNIKKDLVSSYFYLLKDIHMCMSKCESGSREVVRAKREVFGIVLVIYHAVIIMRLNALSKD